MCIAHTAVWILLAVVLICKQDGSREEAPARAKGTSSVWSGRIYKQGLSQILRKLNSLGRSWMVWYTYLCIYGAIQICTHACTYIGRYIHTCFCKKKRKRLSMQINVYVYAYRCVLLVVYDMNSGLRWDYLYTFINTSVCIYAICEASTQLYMNEHLWKSTGKLIDVPHSHDNNSHVRLKAVFKGLLHPSSHLNLIKRLGDRDYYSLPPFYK